MYKDLLNKVVFITGGSHGIGRAIAISLAKEGCKISICARDKTKIEDTILALNIYTPDVMGLYNIDALKKEQLEYAIDKTIEKFDTIHYLINVVGGGGRWGNELPHLTDEKVWYEVYEKNAMAAMHCTMKVLPYMLKQKFGRVITISSTCALKDGARPWFGMAKVAEVSLMKNLSLVKEYSRNNITFNTVAPGAVDVPDTGWDKLKIEKPDEYNKFLEELPINRLVTPEEVANVITFLCSGLSSGINGSYIVVDGSETKGL